MEIIPVSRPYIGKEELDAVDAVFRTGWLGMGEQVLLFEQALSRLLQADHVVCTNTGTTALHLALESLGIGDGDEILVPSFTFVATIQAITATGARPVFCDICPDDLNMDVEDARKKMSPRTRAIVPVHYRGFPCDLDEIHTLASENNLFVVEDAAHAFGSLYKGRPIGSFGDVTCFSFDPIKNITCGEGGAIAFRDSSIQEILRQKRLLGIDRDSWSRYRNERSWFYDVVCQGYRYHMSNINAAIGLVQLSKFEWMNRRKIEVAKRYDEVFSHISGVDLLRSDNYHDVGLFLYTLLIRRRRNELMDLLSLEGIGSGIHYIPCHLFSHYHTQKWKLPVTERVYDQILSLPLFPGITDEEVERVICAVKNSIHVG